MNKKGFTLIELLIVVAIIGIVAAIAIPNLLIALQKGKQKATMGDLKSCGTAVESYITDWSMAPAEDDLASLATATYFIPFYIKIMPNTDSWGTNFFYEHGDLTESTQDIYSLTSYGRNKSNDGTTSSYSVTSLGDFNNDIIFSNGQFTVGPIKR